MSDAHMTVDANNSSIEMEAGAASQVFDGNYDTIRAEAGVTANVMSGYFKTITTSAGTVKIELQGANNHLSLSAGAVSDIFLEEIGTICLRAKSGSSPQICFNPTAPYISIYLSPFEIKLEPGAISIVVKYAGIGIQITPGGVSILVDAYCLSISKLISFLIDLMVALEPLKTFDPLKLNLPELDIFC